MSVLLVRWPSLPARSARADPRPWVSLTVAVWVATFVAVAGRPMVARYSRHSVLPDMTTAGTHWAAGEPLYVRGSATEFRYSPLVAAAFVPLARLPGRWAEIAWRSVNFAALVAGLLYAGRAGPGWPGRGRLAAAVPSSCWCSPSQSAA